MYVVSEIINIAKISEYLCANDIAKKGLWGGGVDLQLPNKIFNIRKSVEFVYTIEPTEPSLIATSNYLYALCAPYSLKAAWIINNFSNGSTSPTSPLTSIVSPLRITQADFATATAWNGQNSINQVIYGYYRLQVFANFIARYLTEGVEWERTANGINILLDGFDATVNEYEFYIDISL